MLGNAIARVGSAVLTPEALEAERRRRGPAVATQQIVDDWIGFQATLAKAKAAGFDQDPMLQAQWERWVVSQYQESVLAGKRETAGDRTEAELRTYYEAHLDQFTVPEAVRVSVLFVRSNPKATVERHQQLLETVAALHAQARFMNSAQFIELIRQRSDDQATRYRSGDVGWLTRGMVERHWATEVIEAAFHLEGTGDLSPMVETDRGFYLIRLNERRLEAPERFEDVSDQLRYRLTQRRLEEERATFAREMRAGLDIQVNQPLIDSLALPAAPTKATLPALPGG